MLLVINSSGADTHMHTLTHACIHTHTHTHTNTNTNTHTHSHTHQLPQQINSILRNQVHASIQRKHIWFKSDCLLRIFQCKINFQRPLQERLGEQNYHKL